MIVRNGDTSGNAVRILLAPRDVGHMDSVMARVNERVELESDALLYV
jgi:hypothetical protein